MPQDPYRIQTREQLEMLLGDIVMRGTRFEDWNFDWRVTNCEEGWYIQSSFERPDVDSRYNEMRRGFGRKWLVERRTPETGVVFTAWLAIQQIVTHELHESFTVRVGNKFVRLLDPHKELAGLAVGSRVVPVEED